MWNWVKLNLDASYHFEEHLESLEIAKNNLLEIRNDLLSRLEMDEKQLKRCTIQVKRWLERVQVRENEVNEILQKGVQETEKEHGFCPCNCFSKIELGRKLMEELDAVKELIKAQESFDCIADVVTCIPVVELPIVKTLGLDSTFEKVWRSLEDKRVGIIGICGTGGIGKTTLLKKINNQFVKTSHDFDMVIFVDESRNADLRKLQKFFRSQFGIGGQRWKERSEDEISKDLFRFLRKRKFLLFLDGLAQHVDLHKVGIPSPDDRLGSKIVYTTRSTRVCSRMQYQARCDMEARLIKLNILPEETSFELFKAKLGEDVLGHHSDLPRFARRVVRECCGLPLTLTIVGQAMVGRTDPKDWKDAIRALRSYRSQIPGPYSALKFSFDSLDDVIKICFLYSCLFQENYDIEKDELIGLWIAEGFLNGAADSYEARRQRGDEIVENLKAAGLLESGISEECVRMHDAIRDVALRIAYDHGEMGKILVEGRKFEDWKDAQRVSLWNYDMESLPEIPPCPLVRTLVVRETMIQSFPLEFFQSLPTLVVLDLSNNLSLGYLPAEIGLLINLEHLNLSKTALKELPVELKKLAKLRGLLLDSTNHLTGIPSGVIANLCSLQVFSKFNRYVRYDLILGNTSPDDEEAFLYELDCLQNLNDVSLTLCTASGVQALFNFPKVVKGLRRLSLQTCSGLTSLDVSGSAFMQLEVLEVIGCRSLLMSEMSGHEYLRNLRHFTMVDCYSVQTIIEVDENEGIMDILPSLRTLRLVRMRSLMFICEQTLPFPFLKEVEIVRCPHLVMLPFDLNSAKNSLRELRGDGEWWDKLVWSDESTKHVFSSKFVPI